MNADTLYNTRRLTVSLFRAVLDMDLLNVIHRDPEPSRGNLLGQYLYSVGTPFKISVPPRTNFGRIFLGLVRSKTLPLLLAVKMVDDVIITVKHILRRYNLTDEVV